MVSEKDYTISIVIPSYNQESYISKVVNAALSQSRPAHEIIVVDDGSSDNSPQLLRDFPIKLIQHPQNMGLAQARNSGLQAASGAIVLFIDGDAVADENLVSSIHQEFINSKDAQLAGVGGRGIELNNITLYDRWRSLHARQDWGDQLRQTVPYLFGLCCAYYRNILENMDGFDTFYAKNCAEDMDIGYRIVRAGYNLQYTPKAIVYHLHADDRAKLKRVQSNYFYWAYFAKQRNNLHPWTLFAGTIRRLFTDTFSDLILQKSVSLARLDLEMFWVKMTALVSAARSHHK